MPLLPAWVQGTTSGFFMTSQDQPCSFLQSCEQPSPSAWLPSSQSSPLPSLMSTLPSPQPALQAWFFPLESRHVGSLVQVFEQPLPSPRNTPYCSPASHDSPASPMPKPQPHLLQVLAPSPPALP